MVALLFIGVILVRRNLSNDQFGIYTFLKTCWTYAWMLGGLGLNFVALRFFSELAKKGGHHGFKRLLLQCFIYQTVSIAVLMVGFTIAGFFLEKSHHIGPALMALMVVWAAMQMWKETLKQVFTGYYWVRFVAILSVCCVVAFPALVYVFIVVLKMGATGAILAETIVYLLMILCHLAAYKLIVRQIKQVEENSPEREKYEISNSRIFKYAGAYVGNNIITLLFGKHALVIVTFFVLGDAYTGYFGLAADIPEQGMMFLLLPVMSLIMAALTRAYSMDSSRLPSLIGSYYKMMMIVLMPMFVLSIVFMDKLMLLVFGAKGIGSANLSRYTFLLYVPIIIAIPMSAALNLREKAQRLVPISVITGTAFIAMIVGALLAWQYQDDLERIDFVRNLGILSLMPENPLYLIVFVALLKFVFLSPFVFAKARRVLGSLYIPKAFFVRALGVSLLVFSLWPLRWLWDIAKKSGDNFFLRPVWWLWENLFAGVDFPILGKHIEIKQAFFGTLCVSLLFIVSYVLVLCLGIRLFGLFRREEVTYFRNSHLPGSMFLMRLLISPKHRHESDSGIGD